MRLKYCRLLSSGMKSCGSSKKAHLRGDSSRLQHLNKYGGTRRVSESLFPSLVSSVLTQGREQSWYRGCLFHSDYALFGHWASRQCFLHAAHHPPPPASFDAPSVSSQSCIKRGSAADFSHQVYLIELFHFVSFFFFPPNVLFGNVRSDTRTTVMSRNDR